MTIKYTNHKIPYSLLDLGLYTKGLQVKANGCSFSAKCTRQRAPCTGSVPHVQMAISCERNGRDMERRNSYLTLFDGDALYMTDHEEN